MIPVVTTPIIPCVTGCNRTTTAEQVHMHKEKSQKTTPETPLVHPPATSTTSR